MSVPTQIKQIVLKNAPTKEVNIDLNAKNSTFKLETVPFSELSLKDGEVLLKVLYLSNDPTQRTWIQKDQIASRTYAPPILEGDTINSFGLGEVVLSKSKKHSKGDIVYGMISWKDYAVINEASIFTTIDQSKGLDLPLYLSNVGLTGWTAYMGLKEVGQIKPGQTVVISAAAGATGSMAVQLAKHVFKAKTVIGITGSAEKGKWVESLGADYTFNYNDPDYLQKLSELIGENYVDIFYDNVGGEILDFMLTKVKQFGVVVACGAISGYNDSSKLKLNNWTEIILNRIRVQGFIVSDFMSKIPDATNDIVEGIKSGAIKISEGTFTHDVSKESDPLSKVPEIWYQLFGSEKPNGKLLTKIA